MTSTIHQWRTHRRSTVSVSSWVERIRRRTRRHWRLLEVCGGQTHAIIEHGLDRLLADTVTFLHGPGCPVCVTDPDVIAQAIRWSRDASVTLCTFGDMVRVPSPLGTLQSASAAGADIRVIYSPLDAVQIARERLDRRVILFAVGFETTAPAYAMALRQARALGLGNLQMLPALKRVPPILDHVLSDAALRIDGVLAAGHVCTVMGYDEYAPLAQRHQLPMVVTGFEPVDVLRGVWSCIDALERHEVAVINAYTECVQPEGNGSAMALMAATFEPVEAVWAGFGALPGSGWGLTSAWRSYDVTEALGTLPSPTGECPLADVLTGRLQPHQCAAYGRRCTPSDPLGAPMVSAEGVCHAYWAQASGDATHGQ